MASTEGGVTLDLFAELPGMDGPEILRSQLVLPAGLVSYDTDGDASYIDQPRLRDSNFDSVSDKRIELVIDERDYAGGTQGATLHRGKVELFDQAAGYLVLSDADYWDEDFGDWTPVPFPREIAYNFHELTEFREPGMTFVNPDTITIGEELVVEGLFLSNLVEGLPRKHWAGVINRSE